MTDTTTTDEPQPPVNGNDEGGEGTDAPAELEPLDAPERVPFWQRPNVDQFLVPLVLPIVVVLVVVVYVLNVSRLFLSAHGNIPIIMGTVILLMVLIGASVLSSGPRLQTPTIVLITSIFLLGIAFSGWISLGASEADDTGPTALPPTLTTDQTVDIVAAPGGALAYAPDALDLETGLVKFKITWAATGHTFGFHETDTLFEEQQDPGAGVTTEGVAFFPEAGEYIFYCAIPGHETGGMVGTVTVTGPTMTLEEALVEAGNPPGAVAAEGGH